MNDQLDKLVHMHEIKTKKTDLNSNEQEELNGLLKDMPDKAQGVIQKLYDTIHRLKKEKSRLKRKCLLGNKNEKEEKKLVLLNKTIKEYEYKIKSLKKV